MGVIQKVSLRIKNSYRDGGISRVFSNSFFFLFKTPRIFFIKVRNLFYRVRDKYTRSYRRFRFAASFQLRRVRALLGLTSVRGHKEVFFSVIVPVYNHKDYLPLCIQSILKQKHSNFELILIDDCSTQPEVKSFLARVAAEDNRIRVLYNEENRGIVKSTNQGIIASQAPYLAFVDCDDMLPKNALREVAKAVVRRPDADFLFTDRIRIDEKGKQITKEIYGGRPDLAFRDDRDNLLEEMVTSHLKVIKREILLKVGLFEANFTGVQDYDLALKMSEKGNLVYIPKPLYYYRWHNGSVTLSKRVSQVQKSTLVKRRALERRYLYGMPNFQYEPSKKTKLLFVIPWVVMGGAEKVMLELAQALKESGKFEIYFIATLKGGAWKKRFEELGNVEVLTSNNFPDQGSKVDYIEEFIQSNQIDIVHVSNAEEGFLVAPRVWQHYPRPYLVGTLHSDYHEENAGFVRWVDKYAAYFDRFVFVNQLIQEKVGTYFPEELRPSVIYNGVDLARYNQPRIDKNVILYASRLTGEKQPVHVMRLAKEVSKLRKDFEIWIAGEGEYEAEMKYLAEKYKIEKFVRFLGRVDNVEDLYRQAGVTILTSTTEGTPMVFAEALASGSPVAAYDVGGISEMITHGEEGFLVKPGAVKEMARLIDNLFSNKALRKKVSAAAKRRAQIQFDAKDMATKHMQLYESLMQQPSAFKSRQFAHPLLSFVILFFNRLDDSKKCIETIKSTVKLPYEIIILDNNSNDETRTFLKNLEKTETNVRVIYESTNLGCPGGRRKAVQFARGAYIATIDNDMLIDPYWSEDMILRLEESREYMGVVSKVKMLTGLLEFVGGSAKINHKKKTVKFSLIGNAQPADELRYMETIECDWIPGGSTIVKAEALSIAQHCADYINAFEDNDYALQLKSKGYKLVNCPIASALHHHSSTLTEEELEKEKEYIKTRINNEKLLKSAATFYKRWGLVIDDPIMYQMLGLDGMSREELIAKAFMPLNKNVEPYAKKI
jgi:glycosyltransferase involved in cell wall biosynthesis/GT2 family glycosyltransferase